MPRLRRPFLYDRYFFVSVNLLRSRRKLEERDFVRWAIALARMRQKQRFRLTAWVFLPEPAAAGHAIIYPAHTLSQGRIKCVGRGDFVQAALLPTRSKE